METRTEQSMRIEKDSLVKRILLAGDETANAMKLSYVLGVSLGAMPTPERIACYTAYGAGIATDYTDKVYSAVANIVDKF